MKRLRDIDDPSPLVRKAQLMIGATPPLPDSRESMLRIRRELERPRGPMAFARRLPAMVLAGAVVLFGASAFAAVRIIVALQPEAAPAEERPSAHPAVRRARRSPVQPVAAAPAAVEETTHARAKVADAPLAHARAPEEAREVRVQRSAAERPQRSHARRAARRTEARAAVRRPVESRAPQAVKAPEPARSTAPQAEEAVAAAAPDAPARVSDGELVHRAVRALRRDRNPALAARLLDQKAARDPYGPLAEEALSLRIEAALALGDARATSFARDYVARYPRGRYLAIARRALREAER